MAFFRNDAVNLLNLHYWMHALAMSGGGAFFFVYLLKAGAPAPLVMAATALMLAGRFVVRPLVLPAALRWGLRPLLVAGTLICGLQYLVLGEVHGPGSMLLLLCACVSVGDAVYWTTYHAYFAALGDEEHRGHQIGAREAVSAAMGIAAPLASGLVLTRFGPHAAFWTTAVAQSLAAIPLLFSPQVTVAREAPGAFRRARLGVVLFAADGWMTMGLAVVWPMALFRSLGDSFTAFGGALALAALAGAAASLLLGRSIDKGGGGQAVWMACGAVGCVLTLRALSYGQPALAVFANAAGAISAALYTPALMTAVYNQAKGSPCTVRYHMATEGGWDAGAASACLVSALLLWLGAPMSAAILMSLLGLAVNAVLLRRYYGRLGEAAVLEPAAA